MKDKYFIDTNMLKYLISDEELKKHDIIKEFIKDKDCEISIQNLKELANILFKKTNLSNEEIKKYVLIVGKKFTHCLELPNDILNAINYSKRKNFYDALLVATMKRNGINKIITENEKDFVEFKKIEVINPFSKIKLSK
jgi:predicted nucleic acid-binding protein